MTDISGKQRRPKLRFPEFRDAAGWEEKKFDNVFVFLSTANNSRADLSYRGDILYIHYGDIHKNFHKYIDFSKDTIPRISEKLYKNATLLKNGDLIISDASEDAEGIAKSIEVIGLEKDTKAISGLHTILARDIENIFGEGFRGLLFETEYIRKQTKRLAVGTKVYSTSKNTLKHITLVVPDKAEQKKLTDTLSSLDSLISAESLRLEALRSHKQGLMQQLFPAEGEKVPKKRFPEFIESGEWEEKKLGDVAEFSSGGTPSKDVPEFWNGSIPWISASSMYDTRLNKSDLNITDLAVKNGAKIAQKGSLLILVRGSMLYNRVPMGIADIPVSFNQDVKSLKLIKTLDAEFLLHQLLAYEDKIPIDKTGIGAGKIETDELKRLAVFIPFPPEQTRIADCLSSLDSLISAQVDKITELKTFKRGLMQQLFPAPKEVD